jgi:hypothetical protein
MEETLLEYQKELNDQIEADASIFSDTPTHQFLVEMVDRLVDMGYIFDPFLSDFGPKQGDGRKTMQISGYAYDDSDKSIVLILNDFNAEDDSSFLTSTEVTNFGKRMLCFLEAVYNDTLCNYCDPSNDYIAIGREMARRLRIQFSNAETDETIENIKLFIISNRKISNRTETYPEIDFQGKHIEWDVWDIERFYNVALSGKDREPVEVNFDEFSNNDGSKISGIPALKADITGTQDYEAYLTIIPGWLLSKIFIKYGSKLLEGNVRAFLSAKGKVNQGIRKTIINEPTKFFTYNNGIAVTAKDITTEIKDGQTIVTSIDDFQIINGGQTTASLESALRKKESDLKDVFVSMKLTIIKNGDYDDMVQCISKYANSQNKVTDADLFSNHPFHVKFEQLSKQIPAPPKGDSPFQTYWYYERSRGKYEQEQFKWKPGSADRENFQKKFPKNQVIKKEDLAKYETALAGMPHIVALGRAKCMNAFAEDVDQKYNKDTLHTEINEDFYKKAICAAIIYKETDQIVSGSEWYVAGGFKLDVVPYAIAKIISAIPKGYSLDFNLIWKKQTMYPSLIAEMKEVAKIANNFINDSGGVIPSEYAKKAATWDKFKAVPYIPSADFLDDLLNENVAQSNNNAAKLDAKVTETADIITKIYEKGGAYWKRLQEEGLARHALLYDDLKFLRKAALIDDPGNPSILTDKEASRIWSIRDKLDKNGVIV